MQVLSKEVEGRTLHNCFNGMTSQQNFKNLGTVSSLQWVFSVGPLGSITYVQSCRKETTGSCGGKHIQLDVVVKTGGL